MRRSIKLVVVAALAVTLIGGSAVVAYANGPIPGCGPATHVKDRKSPVDGGKIYHPGFHHRPPLWGPAIAWPWWNLNNPKVVKKSWNPGQPPWDQDQVKVMIPEGIGVRFIGMGGEWWHYRDNLACNHNLPFEFRHAPEKQVVTWQQLKRLGLIIAYRKMPNGERKKL